MSQSGVEEISLSGLIVVDGCWHNYTIIYPQLVGLKPYTLSLKYRAEEVLNYSSPTKPGVFRVFRWIGREGRVPTGLELLALTLEDGEDMGGVK